MSAASDRIQELVYPTKPRLYVGLGDPPEQRVTAADLKAVIDERAALLEFVEMIARMQTENESGGIASEDAIATVNDLIETARPLVAKARGGK